MNKLLLLLIICFLFTRCEHPESKSFQRHQSATSANEENRVASDVPDVPDEGYKVIGVKDGDTIVLLINGKEQVIRFAHVDCPEKNQPYGVKAKQFVSNICFGEYIKLVHSNEFDRNQRLIAEIILHNGVNVNKELVRNGLAWHYKRYSKDDEYSKLELDAREHQVGIWTEANPTPPWEWRR